MKGNRWLLMTKIALKNPPKKIPVVRLAPLHHAVGTPAFYQSFSACLFFFFQEWSILVISLTIYHYPHAHTILNFLHQLCYVHISILSFIFFSFLTLSFNVHQYSTFSSTQFPWLMIICSVVSYTSAPYVTILSTIVLYVIIFVPGLIWMLHKVKCNCLIQWRR